MTGHLHLPSHPERTLKTPLTQLCGKEAAVESVGPTESQFLSPTVLFLIIEEEEK